MKTDITVVLDRSGSMSIVADDTKHGFDQFVRDQREVFGTCALTLVQFDTEYEFVHRGVAIGLVPELKFQPRGMTALLDAMGRAITDTGARLKAMEAKPEKVVFVIMTDGHENSSHEYTRRQINDMITHQRSVYNWEFVFLGANQDSIAEARSFGISTANAMDYGHTSAGISAAFVTTSSNLKNLRTGQAVNMSYSADQRKEAKDEPNCDEFKKHINS